MAVSPILLNTLPFDATLDHTLHFTYSGSQIFAHRVVIKANDTMELVYDKKTDAMAMFATIPANSIDNGKTYNVQISVFDHEDVESPLSNVAVLKCFLTPTFEFINVTEASTIRNSYLDAELNYVCEDATEPLNEYTVYLYDSNQTTVVFNSGTKYINDGMTVKITGMVDDVTYYVRATGKTLTGMDLDTGFIQIMCDYIKPDIFLTFRADNIPEEGIVRLSSNFISIEGKSVPEELIYIDDEKVSLLNGEKVYFDQGYVAKDFTCDIVAEDFINFSTIITFNMKTAMAYVTWNYGTFEGYDEPMYYAELTAYQYIGTERLNYIQISNLIEPLQEDEQAHIWIRHVSGAFDLKIVKKNKATEASEVIEEGVDVA